MLGVWGVSCAGSVWVRVVLGVWGASCAGSVGCELCWECGV